MGKSSAMRGGSREMLIIENLKLALFSIRSNKMRAFLTMLGIIIGITSVISISALGESSKSIINKQFEGFNKNLAIIFPAFNQNRTFSEDDFFTPADLDIIRNRFSDKIEFLAPNVTSSSPASHGNKTESVSLYGVSSDYTKMEKINMVKGRFLNQSDINSKKFVGVANIKLAQKLFNNKNPIGEEIKVSIEGMPVYVTIVGVYEVEDSLFTSMMGTSATNLYTPYSLHSTAIEQMGHIQFKVRDEYSADVNSIAQDILHYLEMTKGLEEGAYEVQTVEGQQGMINDMLGTLSLAIAAIGGISLLVGGIGIMNIMLVSVTERTREIGIRKSLGARKKDILMQFLIESMIVSALGGLIGVSLGIVVSTGVAIWLDIPNPVTPAIVLGTVTFSAVVGIFFGIYPANKAAKLDPIDALRYE